MNGAATGKDKYKGRKSPTFVRLKDKAASIEVPINRIRPVACRTDVENGYLQRTDVRGSVLVGNEVRDKFGIRENLLDGRLTIYFEPLEDRVEVGETFTFRIGLKDDAIPAPIESAPVTVRIAAEAEKSKPGEKKPKPEPKSHRDNKNNGLGGESAATHGLPKCVLLTREGEDVKGYAVEKWPEGFTTEDGGFIEDLGEEVIYKINYHNAYHLKYRDNQRGQVAKDVVTEKYILGMRILMLGFEQAYRAMKEAAPEKEALNEAIEHVRRMAARGAASTVLALAENLPKIVDKSSLMAAEDE